MQQEEQHDLGEDESGDDRHEERQLERIRLAQAREEREAARAHEVLEPIFHGDENLVIHYCAEYHASVSERVSLSEPRMGTHSIFALSAGTDELTLSLMAGAELVAKGHDVWVYGPQATAEAEPLEEPPGTRSGAAGLSGVP